MTHVIPTLRYEDPDAAIAWLTSVVGFTEHAVHRDEDGAIVHAELAFGDGYVMIGEVADGPFGRPEKAVIYLVVDDPDAIDAGHQRALDRGADVVMPVTEQDYGSREYAVRDPAGNVWSLGTYRPA